MLADINPQDVLSTRANRACSLRGFLQHAGLNDVLRSKDIPRYTGKLVLPLGPRKLRALFAACTPEEAKVYKLILGAGLREQEAMYSCWSDPISRRPS